MKKFLFFPFLLLVFASAAQEYSYVSDRYFPFREAFFGYDFRPAKMTVPNVSESDLEPGEYSFGLTPNNVYAEGEGVRGVYTITTITPEEYGFKVAFMNARDSRIQGHLKIIKNRNDRVEALIFKRGEKDDPEIIFELPRIEPERAEREADYFTDLGERRLEHPDSLWNEADLLPFFRVYMDEGVQQRLQPYDSTRIGFEKVVTREEKVKKSKKRKGQPELDENGEPIVAEGEEDPEVKVKITITDYLVVRELVRYEDGTEKIEESRFVIDKLDEGEDETATGREERFRIELKNKRDIPIYIYLDADRNYSSVEIGSRLYLMRGW